MCSESSAVINMEIKSTLLCLGLTPLAMGSVEEDELSINEGRLFINGETDSEDQIVSVDSVDSVNSREIMESCSSLAPDAMPPITFTQIDSPALSAADSMLGTSSYTRISLVSSYNNDFLTNGGDYIAHGDEVAVNELLSNHTHLIVFNGACSKMDNAKLHSTSQKEKLYTTHVDNDISENFTSDAATMGGSYAGDLTITPENGDIDDSMNYLKTENLGIDLVITDAENRSFTEFTLACSQVKINYEFEHNIGVGASGSLIPEPSTASLSLLALVALLSHRRRREQQD